MCSFPPAGAHSPVTYKDFEYIGSTPIWAKDGGLATRRLRMDHFDGEVPSTPSRGPPFKPLKGNSSRSRRLVVRELPSGRVTERQHREETAGRQQRQGVAGCRSVAGRGCRNYAD